jgi:undecaprenyl-phosphate 4-deoxy-4-formamido-L-arabinose transferase
MNFSDSRGMSPTMDEKTANPAREPVLVEVSVVIPVFNEEQNLEELFERLTRVLDGLGKPFEIVFTNDGSSDRSWDMLREFHRRRPGQVCVIDFNGNFGQHTAIMAAFERVRGAIVVTLDADLQNPPEEIPKLLAKIAEGYDAVGGYRKDRQDKAGRRWASRLINRVREWTTDIRMTDQGCMLRAYRRAVVKAIVQTGERSLFIPALAYKFAARPGEVEVEHRPRAAGESKYSYYKLIRLNFDLITGFTLVPLQLFTLLGFIVSGLSGLLVLYMAWRRIFLGPEVEGVFTLFAILYFLVSVAITGIGLVGEYVGRTYMMTLRRPRYVTREILDSTHE